MLPFLDRAREVSARSYSIKRALSSDRKVGRFVALRLCDKVRAPTNRSAHQPINFSNVPDFPPLQCNLNNSTKTTPNPTPIRYFESLQLDPEPFPPCRPAHAARPTSSSDKIVAIPQQPSGTLLTRHAFSRISLASFFSHSASMIGVCFFVMLGRCHFSNSPSTHRVRRGLGLHPGSVTGCKTLARKLHKHLQSSGLSNSGSRYYLSVRDADIMWWHSLMQCTP